MLWLLQMRRLDLMAYYFLVAQRRHHGGLVVTERCLNQMTNEQIACRVMAELEDIAG